MHRKILKRSNKSFKAKNVRTGLKLPFFFLEYLDWLFILLGRFIRYSHPFLLGAFRILGKITGLINPLYLPKDGIVRLNEYLLELEDGAKLATDIYFPKKVYKNREKCPTLLVRLPYWKNLLNIIGYYFASRGYVTIMQDIRGSARSIDYGTNSLYIYERVDGLQTLRWITERFWYNEKIGMWGLSYLGTTQLAVSWGDENAVTCLAPIHCSYANVFWHPGGLYPIGLSGSLVLIMKSITKIKHLRTINFDDWDKEGYYRRLFYNPLFSLYNEPLDSRKPKLSEMSTVEEPKYLMKIMNKVYNTNVDISKKDTGEFEKLYLETFYKRNIIHDYNKSPYAFGLDYKLNTPMLYIGGWYDMFIEHMLHDVNNIQKYAPEFFKNKFKMIIGPWSHIALDKLFIQPLRISHMRAIFDFFQNLLPFPWYEYWLKENNLDFKYYAPIQAFILNRNGWRYFNKWPPKTEELKLYLHSDGNANTLHGDGFLSEFEPEDEPTDKFTFNPANPVISKGGRNLFLLSGPHNQRSVERRNDILIYSTEILKKGLEIIGQIKFVLYASTNVKDTDFMVKLLDVSLKGFKAVNVIDSGIRTRFRERDLSNPSFLESERIYKYEFPIGSIAIYFPKGHRIRIEISSSNFPRFDVNSNLAGEKSEDRFKNAEQMIYHDSEHQSHLIIPIFKRY